MQFVIWIIPCSTGSKFFSENNLLLSIQRKGNIFLRCFAPVVMSLSLFPFYGLISNPNNGLLNALLKKLALLVKSFLTSPNASRHRLCIHWQGAGYQMLLFLGGLCEYSARCLWSSRNRRCQQVESIPLYYHAIVFKPTALFVLFDDLTGS